MTSSQWREYFETNMAQWNALTPVHAELGEHGMNLISKVFRASAIAVLVALAMMSGLTYAETYYVANAGADEHDGKTPDTAWRTLDRVNSAALAAGDSVLFKCGDAWRGQLRSQSGDETAPIRYAAYGTGEKPAFIGSVSKSRAEDWIDEGGNIWRTHEPAATGDELLKSEQGRGWTLYVEKGAAAQLTNDADGMHIECATPGKGGSDIQCIFSRFPIESSRIYLLTFRAKCSVPLKLTVPTLMQSGPPWASYGYWATNSSVSLNGDWTPCACYYRASQTKDDARLTFFLGTALPSGARLSLDAISFRACDAEGFLTSDVGNIIFDGEKSCGVKVWNPEDLNAQDKYWYDETRHVLKVYSTANPASVHSAIECAIREHIIDQSGRGYVVYENLALKYGAAHGIGGGSTHHITARDCDISYIGGGDQSGGDKTVRFGNGIEFWGSAHDCLVEGCRLWEIYDAALTNQSSGPLTPHYNITYRNNVIWNSEYSFEYWNRPEPSETYNVRFEHNTCFNAGYGWGHAQRPDPSGRHLCFYDSPARAHDVAIRDNIFCGALGNAFYAPMWTREAIDALDMDRNYWLQAEGDMISIAKQRYAMSAFADYQKEFNKEPHSLAADPGVVDAANHDYRLRPDSPCRTADGVIGADSEILERSIPQTAER